METHDWTKLDMFGLHAWLYESESQRTSDRIKSVFVSKHKSGQYIAFRPPYGYDF